MSNGSQESPASSRPRFCPSALTQIQIERLKREDEEEHWISGEELYTEGSSEDDEGEAELRGPGIPIRGHHKGPFRPKHWHQGQLRTQTCSLPQVPLESKVFQSEEPQLQLSIGEHDQTEIRDSRQIMQSTGEITEGAACATEESDQGGLEEKTEISWRPKRDGELCEDELFLGSELAAVAADPIAELRELQFEYSDILDSVYELKAIAPVDYCGANSKDHNDNETEICTIDTPSGILVRDLQQLQSVDRSATTEDSIIMEDAVHNFFSEDVDRWSNAIETTVKLRKEIVKMVQLDVCIEELDEQVKAASEGTRRAQFLNRKNLQELQNFRAPETGHLKNNTQKFLKLCTVGMESMEGQKTTNVPQVNISNKDFLEATEESLRSQQRQLEQQLTLIAKQRVNFIEKNKELASCAMGTLAITDEEKIRLEKLISEDLEQDDGETDEDSMVACNLSDKSCSSPYTIDCEAVKLLSDLNERLANLNSATYWKIEEGEQEEQFVLNSLRSYADTSSKVIIPVSEEEIRQLINEYHMEKDAVSSHKSSQPVLPESSSRGEERINEALRITQETITKLVDEARTTMPLFQFKHQAERNAKIDYEENMEGA